MSKFNKGVWESSLGEIRRGAIKYVEAMVKVMEATVDASDPMAVGKNMVYMGYAMGGIAGKSSDGGIEGFTLLLNGIKISLKGEDRKEKIVAFLKKAAVGVGLISALSVTTSMPAAASFS